MLASKLAKAGPSFTRSVSSSVPPGAFRILSATSKSKAKASDVPLVENEDAWSTHLDSVSAKVPSNTLYRNAWTKGQRRYSTRAGEGSQSEPPLTSPSRSSSWDHIFDNLSPTPPPNSSYRRALPLGQSSSHLPAAMRRRQTMSKSELSAFNDMFDMIFNALGDKGVVHTSPGVGGPLSRMRGAALQRQHKQTSTEDKIKAQMELDRQIEEIELCENDYELMQWALRKLFDTSELPHPVRGSGALAHLLRILHTKFHNPHLALALFQYARDANTSTYVMLCTAPVYGELIRIQWSAFRDLGAVRASLEEMCANGVDPDGFVRRVVLSIGRELSGREGVAGVIVDGRVCGTGIDEKEVWDAVRKCEAIVRSTQPDDDHHAPDGEEDELRESEWVLEGEYENSRTNLKHMVEPGDTTSSYPKTGFA